MTDLPDDLVPLPTQPYDVRPAELPLVIEECRTALWRTRGNVTRAAELLKVPSGRLRAFVGKSEYLTREQKEAQEQLLDLAEDDVYDALTDANDPGRKDSMARFVLTQLGQSRGYGGKTGVGLNLPGKSGTMVIQWQDGSNIVGNAPEPEQEMIDITPEAANG